MLVKNQNYNNYNASLNTYSNISKNKRGMSTSPFVSKENQVSFSGLSTLLGLKKQPKIKMVVVGDVSKQFQDSVSAAINAFPSDILELLSKNGYKVILSPSITQAYKSQGVIDPFVEYTEIKNPDGLLGITYSEGRFGNNFFVFSEKQKMKKNVINRVVNHEFSHGIVNIKSLDKNEDILKALKRDIALLKEEHKFEQLKPEELKMVSSSFFSQKAHLPIDEIIADSLAWHFGSGCYGSKLFCNQENPNLMKFLFPNVNAYISDY